MIKLEDNGKRSRFVLYENDEVAGEMVFVWAGDGKFIIEHTEVGTKFNGKGYGKDLVMAGVDHARKNNLKIITLCPYAKSRFDKDPGIRDVLA